MTATGQNFEIFAGDDRDLEVTVLDDDNVSTRDITNCVLRWVFYKRFPENIVFEKTTASGILITVPASGRFTATLIPYDTETLLGDYNHECELTDTNNKISTILVGTMKVYKSKA